MWFCEALSLVPLVFEESKEDFILWDSVNNVVFP